MRARGFSELGNSYGQYNRVVWEWVLFEKADVNKNGNKLIKPKCSFEEELRMGTIKCDLDTRVITVT